MQFKRNFFQVIIEKQKKVEIKPESLMLMTVFKFTFHIPEGHRLRLHTFHMLSANFPGHSHDNEIFKAIS